MDRVERVKQMGTGGKFAPAVAATLPFEIVEIERGRVVLEMEVKPEYLNPGKTLHGGIISYLVDTAMGFTYATTLADDVHFTSVDLNLEFLKPMFKGKIRAEGEVIKSGATLALLKGKVYDENQRLMAYGTSTCINLT